jgi:hypothetical protein
MVSECIECTPAAGPRAAQGAAERPAAPVRAPQGLLRAARERDGLRAQRVPLRASASGPRRAVAPRAFARLARTLRPRVRAQQRRGQQARATSQRPTAPRPPTPPSPPPLRTPRDRAPVRVSWLRPAREVVRLLLALSTEPAEQKLCAPALPSPRLTGVTCHRHRGSARGFEGSGSGAVAVSRGRVTRCRGAGRLRLRKPELEQLYRRFVRTRGASEGAVPCSGLSKVSAIPPGAPGAWSA